MYYQQGPDFSVADGEIEKAEGEIGGNRQAGGKSSGQHPIPDQPLEVLTFGLGGGAGLFLGLGFCGFE